MSEVSLALKSVTKTYGKRIGKAVSVLGGITLDIHRGEIVGLLAPSGAGKSTLLHIAGLLETPDSGNVEIGGINMNTASDRLRTRTRRTEIGFVYQFHHLLPEFNARENVMLPQLANGSNAASAATHSDQLLAMVGMEARAEHRPAELSGGEQQRVALCRALANGPRIVLADEPTGNLDPTTAAQVFDAMMLLVRETGRSALIATHNLELAARMDRCVRLHNGMIA
ncbi:MAG: ABC transporter ATP-binding protein [Rhodobacteraceae bacterium]|nr:ABC transporter ATP-binding protein [Paracoccaceae bacterium]